MILDRVKSLKLTDEITPLFDFLIGKMTDVACTKEASFALLTILENVFLTKRFQFPGKTESKGTDSSHPEAEELLNFLLDLLNNAKFFLPAYEQAVRLNLYKSLVIFTKNEQRALLKG